MALFVLFYLSDGCKFNTNGFIISLEIVKVLGLKCCVEKELIFMNLCGGGSAKFKANSLILLGLKERKKKPTLLINIFHMQSRLSVVRVTKNQRIFRSYFYQCSYHWEDEKSEPGFGSFTKTFLPSHTPKYTCIRKIRSKVWLTFTHTKWGS